MNACYAARPCLPRYAYALAKSKAEPLLFKRTGFLQDGCGAVATDFRDKRSPRLAPHSGRRTWGTGLELFPEAIKEAEAFLANEKETQDRLARVTALIDGYETPYGLELLSTVHWVVMHDRVAEGHTNANPVVEAVHTWNEHKRRTFTPQRIVGAWERLKSEAWFEPSIGPAS
jgi:hypothetical protein